MNMLLKSSYMGVMYRCQRSATAGRLRVIRTQATAAARRKTAYKGGRSLTTSQVRAHKLVACVRRGLAPAKKH